MINIKTKNKLFDSRTDESKKRLIIFSNIFIGIVILVCIFTPIIKIEN